MDISVVIPVDGRFGHLARALETILRQPSLASSLEAEVIVVDNARTESARRATRDACVNARNRHASLPFALWYVATQHANPSHRNASYPRNVGIRLAAAPVVLMADADVLHVTETLAQHVRRHEQVDRLLVYSFCRDCPADISLSPEALQRAVSDERFALRMASYADWFGGMCCSAKRQHLLQLRGFEESFTYWGYEDYDLARRAQHLGATVVRDDDSQVLHQVHPLQRRGAVLMKAYAGIRQLLGITSANRRRPWGQTSQAVKIIQPGTAHGSDHVRGRPGNRASRACLTPPTPTVGPPITHDFPSG